MINLDLAKLLAKEEPINFSIGIQKEHTLHKVFKYLLDPTGNYHEVRINKKIVDVYKDNQIYEIQTKSFNNLRDKLDVLLNDYKVTIIYPCIIKKYISKINLEGEVISYRKSPKKGNAIDSLVELYRIKNYLKHPNLDIFLILIEVKEYQQLVEKSYRNRRGKIRIDQVPEKILDEIKLHSKEDYIKILPDLPETFTASDFKKAISNSSKQSSFIIQVLKHLEVIKCIGKKGRAYLYQVNKKSS